MCCCPEIASEVFTCVGAASGPPHCTNLMPCLFFRAISQTTDSMLLPNLGVVQNLRAADNEFRYYDFGNTCNMTSPGLW